jgi:phage baseplate assembly protein gpV
MGTLVCTVELDKVGGLTVTVENADSSTTQTVKMNGTTIELKVEGPAGTSTITQSADKVAVACKDFEVTAEGTIKLTSSGASSWHSDQTIALDAPQKVSASSSGTVSLEGTQSVTVSGTQATIKADATLQLESSAAATFKGQMTSVEGNLVTIG